MASTSRSQARQQSPAAQDAPPAQPDNSPPPSAESSADKRQPVFTWTHSAASGRIEIAVWDKVVPTDDGERTLYSVTCHRSYRKQEGGYENTGAFWPTDLLVLAHGLAVVFDRIKQMQESARRDIQDDIPY